MRAALRLYAATPIHWKLTLWSAVLLCLLFAANNAVQFIFVERWMMKQEENRIQKEMKELLNVLLAKEIPLEPEYYDAIRHYLERANSRNGMIRIVAESGEPLLIAADNMSAEWIAGRREGPAGVMSMFMKDGMLVMRSPITIFEFQGDVEIVKSMKDIDGLIAAFYEIMIICSAAAIILSGLGGRWLARLLINPLRAM